MRLELLRNPALFTEHGRKSLSSKEGGLFAYLVVEGPTPRARLAGLLWPEVGEQRARANLRQMLHRLEEGGKILQGPNPLAVPADLDVDLSDTFDSGELVRRVQSAIHNDQAAGA